MGSKEFNMRLVEMVAISVHQIAVSLFNLVPKSHTPEHIKFVTEWQKPSGWSESYGRRTWEEPLYPPRPTHFFHHDYVDFDLYPNGLADVAGYWAEDRILGGVVVFDRGQSGTDCKDIFLHSGRGDETFRIWRLLESQLTGLVDFLLGKTLLGVVPLPLTSTNKNVHRFDPWDAIALYHVFRDPWERRIPLEKPPERDVRSVHDYPEIQTMFDKMEEVFQRADAGEKNVSVTVPEPDRITVPANPDRLWIYRHGGHMGEPLGSRRLPYIGPPEEDRKDKASPPDGARGDYEYTEGTFGTGYRTPSPLRHHDSESVISDAEALVNEALGLPRGYNLDQEIDTTGQTSIAHSRAEGDIDKIDEQVTIKTAVETCDQGADGVGKESANIGTDENAASVASGQPQRLSGKRKAEDAPASE